MSESVNCPLCGKENSSAGERCKHCNTDLGSTAEEYPEQVFAPDDRTDLGDLVDDRFILSNQDEFAELDYRPRSKKGCLIPAMVALLALLVVAAGLFLLNNGAPDPQTEETGYELPEEDEDPDRADPQQPEDPEPETQEKPDVEDDVFEAPARAAERSPDYDQLEAALFNWLIGRIGDPQVIMIPVDRAEDADEFYARYDPQEENILVYKIESEDEEFVTVLFGPPFSEWLIKTVFIWDHAEWRFLREDEVQ